MKAFLVVKGAAGFEFLAAFFQRHATADDIDDVGASDQFVDEGLRMRPGMCLSIALSLAHWPTGKRVREEVNVFFLTSGQFASGQLAGLSQLRLDLRSNGAHVGAALGLAFDDRHHFAMSLMEAAPGLGDSCGNNSFEFGVGELRGQIALEERDFFAFLFDPSRERLPA